MGTEERESMSDLFKKEKKIRHKLLNMRFERACGKLSDVTAPRKSRKQLARVLTKINMGNLRFNK